MRYAQAYLATDSASPHPCQVTDIGVVSDLVLADLCELQFFLFFKSPLNLPSASRGTAALFKLACQTGAGVEVGTKLSIGIDFPCKSVECTVCSFSCTTFLTLWLN